MNLNESLKTWGSYWRSTAVEPYVLAEEKMAEKWNQRSACFGRGRERENREGRNAESVSFLGQNGVTIKGARGFDIGCDNGALALPLARLSNGIAKLALIFLYRCSSKNNSIIMIHQANLKGGN